MKVGSDVRATRAAAEEMAARAREQGAGRERHPRIFKTKAEALQYARQQGNTATDKAGAESNRILQQQADNTAKADAERNQKGTERDLTENGKKEGKQRRKGRENSRQRKMQRNRKPRLLPIS